MRAIEHLRRLLIWPGAAFAIASAVLFGASTPFAKVLLGGGVSPWLLAGLLYLGSGIGLSLVHLGGRFLGIPPSEAPLRRGDLPWLALVVLFGGMIGPLLLMVGLSATSASSASLLLNLESLATMVIAWVVFRENVDRRLLIGAAAILAGALLLSWQGTAAGFGVGSLAIAGACLAWGIDNNLTRKLSSADPLQISLIKGLVAGTVNLALALATGAHLPGPHVLFYAGLIGFFGYGVSLVLFVLGLRFLGAARTGAYFSTAPFAGALLAIFMFGESVTLRLAAAGLLMAIGLYFHLAEAHEHEHRHEAMEHEHRHVHDAHHKHEHRPDDPPGEPHSHRHRHEPLAHSHAHYPDLHHRHGHADAG
jgi:drug/metabolite transporter (DMT)-like permease